jgi:hypothetical protein
MTNRGCSSAAKRKIHPYVRRRLLRWILRYAQNDRKNSAGRILDQPGYGFIETALMQKKADRNPVGLAKEKSARTFKVSPNNPRFRRSASLLAL